MEKQTAQHFIKCLNLQLHPEGGWYRETYRAAETIPAAALPERFPGDRQFSTAIYYLLEEGDFSAIHRIKSDECWHWYAGGTLYIHVIEPGGNYYRVSLGCEMEKGELFQFVVPALAWFASEPAPQSDFVLTGCTVSPGFDFSDFAMAEKNGLIDKYPNQKQLISRLCRYKG